MKMHVPDIQEIWDEILSEKMIKKNKQYGNSVYDTDTIFSDIGDPEELIKIRLDDKMRRLKTLDPDSEKYDSELMEIIAYVMHLLNWRRNNGKYDEKSYTYEEVFSEEITERKNNEFHFKSSIDNRYERDEIKSPKDTGKILRRGICNVGIQ